MDDFYTDMNDALEELTVCSEHSTDMIEDSPSVGTHVQNQAQDQAQDQAQALHQDQIMSGNAQGVTQSLAAVRASLAAVHASPKPKPMQRDRFVGLNVGGVVYKTSVRTLIRYPNSRLGVMFLASVPKEKDEQGNYMLDGDGPMFRHLLNYMRRGALSLPRDFTEHVLLQREADYFQLPELRDKMAAWKEPTSTNVIEVYVSEKEESPQEWRIHGAQRFLDLVPILSDYMYDYRKGSQCLSFDTQHAMFPAHVNRRFPKVKLFFQISELGFKLHTTDCINTAPECDSESATPWLRYVFTDRV